MIIKELPASERPREKMIEMGPEYLSNSELIAILLATGTQERSAVAVADELIFTGGRGLEFLAECTLEELSGIKGIGTAKACRIAAAVELGRRLSERKAGQRINVSSPDSIAALFMDRLRDKKKEFFKILLLNSKADVISIEDMAVGDLSHAIVHPREVFSIAVRKSAAAVIVVHNHPSGSPAPSRDDIETTKKLAEAGELLGIRVLDHIIIGDGRYCSFREKNLL